MKWNKMSEKHWESQSTWCEGQQLKQHANGRYIETVDKVKRMEDVELKNQEKWHYLTNWKPIHASYFQMFCLWVYLMKVIPETRCTH